MGVSITTGVGVSASVGAIITEDAVGVTMMGEGRGVSTDVAVGAKVGVVIDVGTGDATGVSV